MATVFNAVSLPLNGSTVSLDNVTVSAKYPAKMAKNNKLYRNIEATDSSGSIKITLWGAAAQANINDGGVYSIQGPLKRGDYNGTPQLSGENGITFVPAGAASASPQSATVTGGGGEQKLGFLELADQMATFTLELEQSLLSKGIMKESVNKIIERAPEFAALWWFGAKGLNMEIGSPVEEENPY